MKAMFGGLLLVGAIFFVWDNAFSTEKDHPIFFLSVIAKIPHARNLQAIQILDAAPDEVLVATENIGAYCGGGAPSSIWKVYIDSSTREAVSTVKMQDLSPIQNVRYTLFEASGGTLFTGSGWCGYKPAMYSTDGGQTWTSADSGSVHPPNSTFTFAEFKGEVYVGTGYSPYRGQIYQWLGKGEWKQVFEFPSRSRSIVNGLQVHNGKLFAVSTVYGAASGDCHSSTAAYASSDGISFEATPGIPPCYSIYHLLKVRDQLVAFAVNYYDKAEQYVYLWKDNKWHEYGALGLKGNTSYRPIATESGIIYASGHISDDSGHGIYASTDFGLTWDLVAMSEDLVISTLHFHNNTLYAGSKHDASNTAYLYKVVQVCEPEVDGDLDCNAMVDRQDISKLLTFKNQTADVCPHCDLDGDGWVTILDARRLITMCDCSGCACKGNP